MRPRSLRILQAFIVSAAVTFLLAVILTGGSTERPVPRTGFELVPFEAGGPAGVAYLERGTRRITGTLAVWGLAPGTRHYAALRGPGARCRGRLAQIVRALPPLVADENGVAFGRIDEPAPSEESAAGLGLTVHADADAGSSAVACGTATGGPRLTAAQLSALGGRETGAPGTAVSALVQLRAGRPIADPGGVQVIRARRGQRVALALRADEPDELRLAGYGLTVQVGPGTIARLSLTASKAGSFALSGRTTRGRPVARLVVQP